MIDFADQVLGMPLDPWQKWAITHIGELREDGTPRFRKILVLVARQNGKSLLGKVLTLYWMAVEQVPLILATNTDRTYAKAAWKEVIEMAEGCEWIRDSVKVHLTVGDEELKIGKSSFKFAANSRRAGRSLTVHRLIFDELREQKTWDTWEAATNAMRAVKEAQVICITNQGDEESDVLNSLRKAALDHIENGDGDDRLGLFEWSAPEGADPTDPEAIAAANPDLGNRLQIDNIMGDAKRALKAGGEELAGFRTETLCQQVTMIDAAIDDIAWDRCAQVGIDLSNVRDRLAVCFDVAPSQRHATLVAAAQIGEEVHVDVVAEWDGDDCIARARAEMPSLLNKVRPARIGWYPKGPAAALTADMQTSWIPKGTETADILSDHAAACMGFVEQVHSNRIRHPKDPMLTRHALHATKSRRGDTWIFHRKHGDPIDALYAASGAVHIARTMPPPKSAFYAG